ncbi:MAG: 4-alpha-glucanotransferase, partial [Scardovia wiggsiae]|nr:4-alpha-glucanotransferase [Scardovia wiggsiae]
MATKKNTKLMKESDERSGRTLIQLAHEYGVATAYTGQDGEFYEIGDEVLIAVLKALNVDASDDAKALKALEKKRRTKHLQLVRPTVLHVQGVDSKVKLH